MIDLLLFLSIIMLFLILANNISQVLLDIDEMVLEFKICFTVNLNIFKEKLNRSP